MADDNVGGSDNSSVGSLAATGAGTGQTAEPGLNPTGSEVEGNDATKINENTGAKAAESKPLGELRQDPDKVSKQVDDEKADHERKGLTIDGEGAYDRGTGRITSGSVTVTDALGVTVTKTAG